MKLSGEYIFDGPREVVWEVVRDPEVLATALPGTQSLTQVSDNEYEGKLNVRIGPVVGVFSGKLVVSNEKPPESYTLTVEDRGGPGFGQGSGDCQLVELDDGTTLMKYEGELQVGGTLANVGQRLIESAANSMAKQAFEALNRALKERLLAEAEGRAVEYTAPSEVEFAAAVAKDMVGEVFTSRRKWLVIVFIIIGVLVAGVWAARRQS
ncbi:MAG: carbon monoxide dehydrogenase subunit G [Anaerolineales bacterium]|nr:carbon monoxide dehydrogenase subunit G [Anaerolineales bacterium]